VAPQRLTGELRHALGGGKPELRTRPAGSVIPGTSSRAVRPGRACT